MVNVTIYSIHGSYAIETMFSGWNSLNLHVGCWKITKSYAVFDGQREVLNILPPSSPKLGGLPAPGPAILRALLVLFHGEFCAKGPWQSTRIHESISLPALFTLWLCQNSYWTWPFIVSFPMKNGGSFHSYVTSFTRGYHRVKTSVLAPGLVSTGSACNESIVRG